MADNYMEEMAKEYNRALKDVDLDKAAKAVGSSHSPVSVQNDLAKRIKDAQGSSLVSQAIEIVEMQIAYIDNLLSLSQNRTRYKAASYLRSIKFTTLRKLNMLLSSDLMIPAHSEAIGGCSYHQITNLLISSQIDLFEVLDRIAPSANINDILGLENRAMGVIGVLN